MSAQTHGRDTTRRRVTKGMLVVGFLAVITAFVAAHLAPARGYELSIYGATPALFWVGVGVALLSSLLVSVRTDRTPYRLGAAVLAVTSVLAVVGLPLLRGYYFYGAGDSLSHLGWARQFVAGTRSPLDLLHPGTHLVAILAGAATNMGLAWAFMLTVVAFFLAFVVFVPLLVDRIADSPRAWTIGLFAALLLLPVNNVSVHPVLHPISLAILTFPLVVFLLFEYVTDVPADESLLRPTPVGALLALTAVSVVLIHPQQAMNVVFLFLGVAVVQFLARRYRPETPFASHRRTYGQAAFVTLAFLVWTPRFGRFQSAVDGLQEGLAGGAPPGNEISQRSASLLQLQGSIEELFLKLFFVSLVFSVIAGAFALAVLTRRLADEDRHRDALVTYLLAGLVPVGVLFLAFFASSYTTQPFRYLGAMMALVTVVGAVAIAYGENRLRDRFGTTSMATGTALVLLFVLLVPLSMAALHPSPYIYQNSAQVPEGRMHGYETTFEIRDPTIPYTGIRGGPVRYVHVHYGPRSAATDDFPGKREDVPGGVFDAANYTDYYDESRYVVVTDADEKRSTELYQGFRYSQSGFDALDATPGLNRVQSNGQVTLYLF